MFCESVPLVTKTIAFFCGECGIPGGLGALCGLHRSSNAIFMHLIKRAKNKTNTHFVHSLYGLLVVVTSEETTKTSSKKNTQPKFF